MKYFFTFILLLAGVYAQATSLPDFFLQTYKDNADAVRAKYYIQYLQFAALTNTYSDTVLREDFFKLRYFHQLFTNNSASNGSIHGALQIPYFWHWVTPNPRADIMYTPLNKLLNTQKPPAGFEKYASWAMVDRTPALYLSDLVSERPQYYHASCDSFYTFGWCSEREMAFVSLMGLYGYKGRIVFSGNHVWSEFLLKYSTSSGARYCTITTDNTFDQFDFALLPNTEAATWNTIPETNKMNKWYNDKGNSTTERQKLQTITVSGIAQKRISGLVKQFWGK